MIPAYFCSFIVHYCDFNFRYKFLLTDKVQLTLILFGCFFRALTVHDAEQEYYLSAHPGKGFCSQDMWKFKVLLQLSCLPSQNGTKDFEIFLHCVCLFLSWYSFS